MGTPEKYVEGCPGSPQVTQPCSPFESPMGKVFESLSPLDVSRSRNTSVYQDLSNFNHSPMPLFLTPSDNEPPPKRRGTSSSEPESVKLPSSRMSLPRRVLGFGSPSSQSRASSGSVKTLLFCPDSNENDRDRGESSNQTNSQQDTPPLILDPISAGKPSETQDDSGAHPPHASPLKYFRIIQYDSTTMDSLRQSQLHSQPHDPPGGQAQFQAQVSHDNVDPINWLRSSPLKPSVNSDSQPVKGTQLEASCHETTQVTPEEVTTSAPGMESSPEGLLALANATQQSQNAVKTLPGVGLHLNKMDSSVIFTAPPPGLDPIPRHSILQELGPEAAFPGIKRYTMPMGQILAIPVAVPNGGPGVQGDPGQQAYLLLTPDPDNGAETGSTSYCLTDRQSQPVYYKALTNDSLEQISLLRAAQDAAMADDAGIGMQGSRVAESGVAMAAIAAEDSAGVTASRKVLSSSGGWDREQAGAPAASEGAAIKAKSQTECKRCSCKRSRCLKLYCECFNLGLYCTGSCKCEDCQNTEQYEDLVMEVRAQVLTRNPIAFKPKVVSGVVTGFAEGEGEVLLGISHHRTGCRCKKSMCTKKYCDCFQAGVGCTDSCACDGCKNPKGRKPAEMAEPPQEKPCLEAIATSPRSIPVPVPYLSKPFLQSPDEAGDIGIHGWTAEGQDCWNLPGNSPDHSPTTPSRQNASSDAENPAASMAPIKGQHTDNLEAYLSCQAGNIDDSTLFTPPLARSLAMTPGTVTPHAPNRPVMSLTKNGMPMATSAGGAQSRLAAFKTPAEKPPKSREASGAKATAGQGGGNDYVWEGDTGGELSPGGLLLDFDDGMMWNGAIGDSPDRSKRGREGAAGNVDGPKAAKKKRLMRPSKAVAVQVSGKQ